MLSNLREILLSSAPTGWGPSPLRLSLLEESLPLLLTFLVLWGLAKKGTLRGSQRAYVGLLTIVIVAFGGLCLARTAGNIMNPPEWDMMAFWMFGEVAASGADFYSPAAFQQLAQSIGYNPSDQQFTEVVLNVGFPYPPPTMLFIAPLGLFEPRVATLIWYVFQYCAAAVIVLCLCRLFMEHRGWLGAAIVAAMLLLLRPTYSTIACGQTNFAVLALILLFCLKPESSRGGAYLAVAFLLKPFVGLLLLYLALRRQWRSLGAALLTLAALSVLTAAIFGADQFTSYVTANPVSRLPPSIFIEHTNQSILAHILRFTATANEAIEVLSDPLYLGVVAVIGLFTVWSVVVCRDQPLWSIGLLLCAALMAYPQSWEHYAVLVILPLLVLWRDGRALGLSRGTVVMLLLTAYTLLRYDHGQLVMFGTALTWSILVYASLYRARLAKTHLHVPVQPATKPISDAYPGRCPP